MQLVSLFDCQIVDITCDLVLPDIIIMTSSSEVNNIVIVWRNMWRINITWFTFPTN